MKIVDAHAHLGTCNVFDLDVSFESLLGSMDANEVSTALVQPFPGCEEPTRLHDRIAQMSAQHRGRFYGVASVNPHLGDTCLMEIKRCVEDLGFVGLKLHTIGHAVLPTSRDALRVCELANELGVPVLVHTGTGIPFAQPSLCLPVARRFPHLKIVLCHAGYAVFAAEAMIVANEAPNIYLEPSWCTSVQLRRMIRELGSERLLMGSDLPDNLGPEIAKARLIGLTDAELTDYLGGSAVRIFNLSLS
ncbi:MAG: amidohydrolase family protein [Proteobacteria bacterium]|nr:amidohydrolase family protein [Pseudomonadota bacterium]